MPIIQLQIIQYLERNLILRHQHVFRRSYSCDTQLTGLIYDIKSPIEAGVQADAMFLDFSKTFYIAPQYRLFHNLTEVNIDRTFASW